jgi:hypothetical protein
VTSDIERTSTPIPRRDFYCSDQAIIGVAICRKPTTIRSSRLAFGGTIDSIAHFDEQTLVAHPGQVTAGNAYVSEIARSHYPSFLGKRNRARSQRRFLAAGEA